MAHMQSLGQPEIGQIVGIQNGPKSFLERHQKVEKWVIAEINPEEIVVERGGERETFPRRYLSRNGKQICWGEGVPDVPEELLGRMLSMLTGSSYSHYAYLVEVKSVAGGRAVCEALCRDDEEEGETAPKAVPIIIPAGNFEPGDIALVTIGKVANDSETLIIEEGEIVPTGMTAAMAREKAGQTKMPFGTYTWPVGDRQSLEIEWGYHLAKYEEDLIVVLSYKDDQGLSTLDVYHQGSKLYWTDNINDDLYGVTLPEGLWIGRDIAWHNNGEDGAEWDAEWIQATARDLIAIGLSPEEVLDTVEDALERKISRFELQAMLSPGDWTQAYRSADEAGTAEAAAVVARKWIENLGQQQQAYMLTMQEYAIQGGGTVQALYRHGNLIATATVTRDQMNFSVLTRWVEPELASEIAGKAFDEWFVPTMTN